MALRILIVEDEAILRSLVTDILFELGHESVAVADGEAAIDCLRADPTAVDLAIIDLMLPGRSGVDTLLALRKQRPGLCAIVCSGHDGGSGGAIEALLDAARREGAALLSKPYRIDQLEAAIARALGGKPA